MNLGTGIIGGAKKFPEVVGALTSASSSPTTSHAVGLPAGNTGDLLLIFFASKFQTANDPAGWVPLVTAVSSPTPDTRFKAWYRVADGSEGSSVTITTPLGVVSARNVYRIRRGRTPEASAVVGGGQFPDPPALSPSWGVEKTLWLAVSGSTTINSHAVSAYPSGWSDGTQITATNGAQTAVCGSARLEAEAGTVNPGAFTLNSTQPWYAAATIAIRPK